MYVCMYVCMHDCRYVGMLVYTCVCASVRACVCMYVHSYLREVRASVWCYDQYLLVSMRSTSAPELVKLRIHEGHEDQFRPHLCWRSYKQLIKQTNKQTNKQ